MNTKSKSKRVLGKGAEYWAMLEAEGLATKKCLERIPESLFEWKPHATSLSMGSLSMMISEIPLWMTQLIESNEIDLAEYMPAKITTTDELIQNFEENMAAARIALQKVSDKELDEEFNLKNKGDIIMSSPKKDSAMSTIHHLIHHRGQLTVYMRMNKIEVPAIYGPSADEQMWQS